MTQPVQTSFLLQATLCATAASALTGCSTEATGVAVGVGVAVVGAGAWAGHRYLSRLRAASSASSSSVARLIAKEPAESQGQPLRIAFRRDVERLEKLLHSPTAKAAQLEEALDILCRQGLCGADEDIAQASGAVLDTAIARRSELITHKLVLRLSESLEKRLGETGGVWSCQLLLQIARLQPKNAVASHAVDILGFVGFYHPTESVAIKAASVVGDLVEFASQYKAASALITSDAIDRLSDGGLKSGRGHFLARKAMDSLKAVSLLSGDNERAIQAFDALAIDGLLHKDGAIAAMAAERITEIADQRHSLVSMLPLVGLRSAGLRPGAPRNLTLAALETMAHIAAPTHSAAGPNLRVAEKALQILFDDALTHPDPEIAEIARRQLRAVYMRRPDIFSHDQREVLATKR